MPNNNNDLPRGIPKRVLEGGGPGLPISIRKYLAEFQGEPEIIRWSLYHYQAYPAAGFTRLVFFGAAGATLGVSNMQSAGQMPAPQVMVVRCIRVPFFAADDTTDVQFRAVLHGPGFLQFTVSHKDYTQGAPLALFPAGFGLWAATTQTGAHYRSNGQPSNEALYKLEPFPVAIPPNRSFTVTLGFDAAQAVTDAAGAGRIGVILDGWLIRPIQ